MWTTLLITMLAVTATAPVAMAGYRMATSPRGQIGSVVLDDLTRTAYRRRNNPMHERFELACRAAAASGITIGK